MSLSNMFQHFPYQHAVVNGVCPQVIEMSKTRDELYSYLKERMSMVAPNLTVLVGELVGARLIAHAGKSLTHGRP